MFTSAGMNANPDIPCLTGSPQPGTESKAKHSMMLEKKLGLFAPVFPSVEERLNWRRDNSADTNSSQTYQQNPPNKTKTKKTTPKQCQRGKPKLLLATTRHYSNASLNPRAWLFATSCNHECASHSKTQMYSIVPLGHKTSIVTWLAVILLQPLSSQPLL